MSWNLRQAILHVILVRALAPAHDMLVDQNVSMLRLLIHWCLSAGIIKAQLAFTATSGTSLLKLKGMSMCKLPF